MVTVCRVITNVSKRYAPTTVATVVPVMIVIPVTVPLIFTVITVTLSISCSRCRDLPTRTTLKHLLLYGTVLLIYTTIIALYFVITPRDLSNLLSTVNMSKKEKLFDSTDIVSTYSYYGVVKH